MSRKKDKAEINKSPKTLPSKVEKILCKWRKWKTQYILKLKYICFNKSVYLQV